MPLFVYMMRYGILIYHIHHTYTRTHPSGTGSRSGTFSISHIVAGEALKPPAPSVAVNFVEIDGHFVVRNLLCGILPSN